MSKKPLAIADLKKWKKWGRARKDLDSVDTKLVGRYLRLLDELTTLQEELVELRRTSFSRRWRAVECPWCNQDRRSSCKNTKCKGNIDG